MVSIAPVMLNSCAGRSAAACVLLLRKNERARNKKSLPDVHTSVAFHPRCDRVHDRRWHVGHHSKTSLTDSGVYTHAHMCVPTRTRTRERERERGRERERERESEREREREWGGGLGPESEGRVPRLGTADALLRKILLRVVIETEQEAEQQDSNTTLPFHITLRRSPSVAANKQKSPGSDASLKTYNLAKTQIRPTSNLHP
jgi:hypothetical protein